MHTLEPHFRWRSEYIASEDKRSPFYGRVYSEFTFSQTIYNYYIHPQWDDIESETLFVKVLYCNYEESCAIIECIGEWNDCINNDIATLKQNLIDPLQSEGISRFILIGENVLNFHSSDECYYEEWFDDVNEEEGWICFVNFQEHVVNEMQEIGIQDYVFIGEGFEDISWRVLKPLHCYQMIAQKVDIFS